MAAAFQVVVISWADTASLVGGQYGGGWCQWWVIFMFTTLLLYFADDLRRPGCRLPITGGQLLLRCFTDCYVKELANFFNYS